jgi:hypothetical protein
MRETVKVVVPEFPGTRNRDINKLFLITEWPAARAERWAIETLLAANKGAGELPTSLAGLGMDVIAIIGINTFLRGNADSVVLIPLWDQLLECVKVIRDPSKPDIAMDLVPDADIKEVATRIWLRSEVLSLHLNFSVGAAFRAAYSIIMTKVPSPDSQNASTSPPK